jgi:kynurenine formamidase
MQISVQFLGKTHRVDLAAPIDISIPLRDGAENANCFYAPYPEFWPVEVPEFGFIGDTRRGGAVNFYNIKINPHGNGTHTECVGHIAQERFYIQDCLHRFHFFAKLLSIWPQKLDNGDRVILRQQLEEFFVEPPPETLILRTLPNGDWKQRQQYSGSNPPYVHHHAIEFLVGLGVQHLLLDLPSVDREEDGGALLGHKAFWQYPHAPRKDCTITELIYVPEQVPDGDYLLNLQISSLELDASPSKPVLYALKP